MNIYILKYSGEEYLNNIQEPLEMQREASGACKLDAIASKTNTVCKFNQNIGLPIYNFHVLTNKEEGFTPQEFFDITGETYKERRLENDFYYTLKNGKIRYKKQYNQLLNNQPADEGLVTELASGEPMFKVVCEKRYNPNNRKLIAKYNKFFSKLPIERLMSLV